MTFITDLLKQPRAAVRLGCHIIDVADTDQIEVSYPGVGENKVSVPTSLKYALLWLKQQRGQDSDTGGHVPVTTFRKQLDDHPDCHFGILQTANFILGRILILGIMCPRNRLLAEIEYSNVGAELPDLSGDMSEDETLTISRFCYLHREDDHVLLTMPLNDKRLVIRERRTYNFLSDLAFGTTLREIRETCGDDTDLFEGFCALVNLLRNEEFIIAVDKDAAHLPTRLEEGDDAMQQWDFHDLVAHANSRLSYNFGMSFGGAFPFVHIFEPRPAVRPLPEGERIELYRPDLKELVANDPSLTETVTRRISMRGYDEESPISLQQIGEFFFRTGRVLYEHTMQVTNMKHPERQTDMGFAWRPYPTGGGSYELEFYLTVDRADGLGPGIYYYSPATHELIKLSQQNNYTEGLIYTAYTSCAQIVRPQVLVHIAARFQRVSWKYHNIAYSTMLRNTGVVYQTFYLNATAMNIAGCGLGSGNSDLFCRATGNEPHIECNIGEFMLGSMPKGMPELNLETSAAMHQATLAPTAY